MPTNPFLNNYRNSGEQRLIEDLIIESIRFYGDNVYYVPRTLHNYDSVYGADDQSSYDQAILIEMYIKSVDGFSGDNSFMSKFGLEIRDQVIFSVSRRVFANEVGTPNKLIRPNEGDLIYFPINSRTFQIKFVNKFEMFYQLGSLQTWELTCEIFEYSSENLNTGIPEIDQLQIKNDLNQLDWAITDQTGLMLTTEVGDIIEVEGASLANVVPGEDNDEIQKESDKFVNWSELDPFSNHHI